MKIENDTLLKFHLGYVFPFSVVIKDPLFVEEHRSTKITLVIEGS
jgi:hypothetical protein